MGTLVSASLAIRPGGVLLADVCDPSHGQAHPEGIQNVITDEQVVISRRPIPAPDRFVREIATFVRNEDGSWRRGDERHDNVLIDVADWLVALPGSSV